MTDSIRKVKSELFFFKKKSVPGKEGRFESGRNGAGQHQRRRKPTANRNRIASGRTIMT